MCLLWEKCLFGEKVLFLGSGGSHILGKKGVLFMIKVLIMSVLIMRGHSIYVLFLEAKRPKVFFIKFRKLRRLITP